MRSHFCLLLAFGPLVVFAGYAHGQELQRRADTQRERQVEKIATVAKTNYCTALVVQRTAAMAAKDWLAQEKFAVRYLNECKAVVDDEALSDADGATALARNMTHRFRSGLQAAQTCKSRYYANPTCHLELANALVGLGRIGEAKSAYAASEKIARNGVDKLARDLTLYDGTVDAIAMKARQDLYRHLMAYADAKSAALAAGGELVRARRFHAQLARVFPSSW